MPSMTMDLVKRVDRLPKPNSASQALQPLFEAVSNAIHSTQSRFGRDVPTRGKVVVTVTTGRRQVPFAAVVQDNGDGLSDQNFHAFMTTDTPNKIRTGGKGVGRLFWLDCFDEIAITSNYERDDELRTRSFKFVLSPDNQITDLLDEVCISRSAEPGAHIRFSGIRDNGYKARFPSRGAYVFQHFVSHFLPILIGSSSPFITVHCNDDTRHYPQDISELIFRRHDASSIVTESYGEFAMTLM